MSRLGQEFPEFGDDSVDQIRKILGRYQRRFTLNDPRCVERYREGESSILVHLRVEGFSSEYVANIQGRRFGGPDEDGWETPETLDRPGGHRVLERLHKYR